MLRGLTLDEILDDDDPIPLLREAASASREWPGRSLDLNAPIGTQEVWAAGVTSPAAESLN